MRELTSNGVPGSATRMSMLKLSGYAGRLWRAGQVTARDRVGRVGRMGRVVRVGRVGRVSGDGKGGQGG